MGAMKKTSSKFNKSEVLKLKEVFDEADKDGSGEIDTAELAQSLQKTNLGEAAADMLRAIDKDGTKSLDFSEYLKVRPRARDRRVESAHELNYIRSSRPRRRP